MSQASNVLHPDHRSTAPTRPLRGRKHSIVTLRLTQEEAAQLDAIVALFRIHRSQALVESVQMAYHMMEALHKIAQETPQRAVALGTTVLRIVNGGEVADSDARILVDLVKALLDTDPRGFRTRTGWFLASMARPEDQEGRTEAVPRLRRT